MSKTRTLAVIPNRFLSLDPDGRPNAVVMRVDTVRPEPIGATLTNTGEKGEELTYEYASEPVVLADHPTHRKALQNGTLLPADEATAKLVGVEYVPVETALERARKAASERYAAEHEGAESEHLHPVLPPPKAPTPKTTGNAPALPIPSTAADKSKDV